jgi:hypothetical protein
MWRRVEVVLTEVAEEQTRSVAPAHAGSLADFFLSSTLKMEAIHSSETSVNTISTRRHVPEDCFLNSYRCEDLKSYKNIDFQNEK